jgi:hypothetical protein
MGSTQSTADDYQSSYTIDIRLNNQTQKITYTIVSSDSGDGIIKSITTNATNRTVTQKVNPRSRQLSDTSGNLIGKDGDFEAFISVVKQISTSLANPWVSDSPVEEVSESVETKAETDESVETETETVESTPVVQEE